MKLFAAFFLLFVVSLQGVSAATEPPAFSATGIEGWDVKSFMNRPHTQYSMVDDAGTKVLQARCSNSASGLIWKGSVDLTRTPVLHWRWKISGLYPGIDEHTRAGDDFPARVYVVTGTLFLPWTLKTLSYVWSNGSGPGKRNLSYWPSPYTDQAQMDALQVGATGVGQWRQEARNVRVDFKKVFGEEIDNIDGVAVMTDCDDAHGHARAWYGDLHFAAK